MNDLIWRKNTSNTFKPSIPNRALRLANIWQRIFFINSIPVNVDYIRSGFIKCHCNNTIFISTFWSNTTNIFFSTFPFQIFCKTLSTNRPKKTKQKKISKFFFKKQFIKKSHQSHPEVPKSAPIQYLSTFPNLGRVFFNFLIEDDKPWWISSLVYCKRKPPSESHFSTAWSNFSG